MESRCPVCLDAPFDVTIRRSDWVSAFVDSCSAVRRRFIRTSRSVSSAQMEVTPTAGQVLRAWRSSAQTRWAQWLVDGLFAHAVVSGVLTLGMREKVHDGDEQGPPPPQAGGRMRSSSHWLLTATIDSGGRHRGASAPELAQLRFRSTCFDPALGGRLLARSAHSRHLETVELIAEIACDGAADKPDPSDEDSLEAFLSDASAAAVEAAMDEASAMVSDLEIEDIAAEMLRAEHCSELEALMVGAEEERLAAEEAQAEAEAAVVGEGDDFCSTDEEDM